jgi:uncharacterized protein YndB with AHSA1/START domain
MSSPVVINRTLLAPIETVFEAWTKPDLLRRWFALGTNWVEHAEVDFRPGGSYKIRIADAEGTNTVFGSYERIEVPRLLVFTWQWEESTFEPGISLVSIELEERGDSTEMTLTHSKLSNQKSEEMHSLGWDKVLDRLVVFVNP